MEFDSKKLSKISYYGFIVVLGLCIVSITSFLILFVLNTRVELSNFPDAIDYAQNILSAVVFTGILAAFLGFANEALNQKDNKKEDDNGSDNQNFNGKVYINIFLYLTVTALFLTVLPNLLYTIIELLPYDSSAELADKYYYLRGFDPSDAYGNKNLFLSNQLNNTSVIMGVVGLFTSYFKSQ